MFAKAIGLGLCAVQMKLVDTHLSQPPRSAWAELADDAQVGGFGVRDYRICEMCMRG